MFGRAHSRRPVKLNSTCSEQLCIAPHPPRRSCLTDSAEFAESLSLPLSLCQHTEKGRLPEGQGVQVMALCLCKKEQTHCHDKTAVKLKQDERESRQWTSYFLPTDLRGSQAGTNFE